MIPTGFVGLARAANQRFAAAAVLTPLGALVVALATDSVALLNFVHVLSGALWVGTTAFLAVVIGPAMARLSPAAREQLATALVPKAIFLLPSIVATVLVSGPVLAVRRGYWNLRSPTLLAALALAAAALLIGLLLLRVQLRTYGELRKASPNAAELDRFARRYAILGRVQTGVLLAAVGVMTAFRSGFLLA